MIQKLRVKFIAASMLSLTLVLLVIWGGVNLMSYQKVVGDADAILSILSANGGAFPRQEPPQGESGAPLPGEGVAPPRPGGHPFQERGIGPETPYESRYFSVLLDASGQALQTDTGQIAAIDDQSAAAYAQEVWIRDGNGGFWEDYRYIRAAQGENVQLIFLDCGRSLSAFRTTLFASVLVALMGLLAVFLLLVVLSGYIVRPVAESYEKQRRFITDAGHELKTPLTIIGADTDLAELECGENEWIADIRRQTKRLTGLTQDLIYLSRMEEEPALQPIEFPLSDVVEEMVQSFLAPAKTQEKELSAAIEPMLSYTGDEKAIRQLLSILLDNALKYAPPRGEISVSLKKEGRFIKLAVSNTTARPVEQAALPRLFDRFYRTDRSRSSETGGYGLGLSIARSIVLAHRGRIRAESPEENTLTIRVELTS